MDYKAEKLNFISNLNGTSLENLVSLISIFPMINFVCVMIKIVCLFSYSSIKKENLSKSKNNFW
jgi:hypothetical protein